jgi:S1-C subfamily serine protease
MVKGFLSQKGVGFSERDVSRDPSAAQEVVRMTGQMGVPVTVVGGETVVGFDRARLERVISQSAPPSLGAAVADASKITSRQGSGTTLGAYVGRVRPGSAAQTMGLAPGDIIIEVNMRRIASANDLEKAVSQLSQGSRVSLVYLRDDSQLTAEGAL